MSNVLTGWLPSFRGPAWVLGPLLASRPKSSIKQENILGDAASNSQDAPVSGKGSEGPAPKRSDRESDALLVERAQKGDRTAAEALVQKYQRRVYGVVFAMLHNREEVMKLVEQTFVVTDALALVALIVAILGIANTLLVAVMDRIVEIGTLRALGASQSQIRKIVASEAAFVALAAAGVGAMMGTLYSAYLIHETMRYQYGWKLDYAFPAGALALTFVVAQVAAWFASWWPAQNASRIPIVEALEAE